MAVRDPVCRGIVYLENAGTSRLRIRPSLVVHAAALYTLNASDVWSTLNARTSRMRIRLCLVVHAAASRLLCRGIVHLERVARLWDCIPRTLALFGRPCRGIASLVPWHCTP